MCLTAVVIVEAKAEAKPPLLDDRPVADDGVAGSSARRVYERRIAKDEGSLLQKWD